MRSNHQEALTVLDHYCANLDMLCEILLSCFLHEFNQKVIWQPWLRPRLFKPLIWIVQERTYDNWIEDLILMNVNIRLITKYSAIKVVA